MKTRVISIDPAVDFSPAIEEASAVILQGGTVAFPTETVYGVAARADQRSAVERLRDVKGRAETKPFTVHIGRRADADRFLSRPIPLARRLMDKGWPGPITLVIKGIDPADSPIAREVGTDVLDLMYHENSIGLRYPDDAVASTLLARCSVPIVAASANRAGFPPAITGQEALSELDGAVDLVLDAGHTRYARASTIVEVSGGGYTVLRTGVVDERTIKRLATLSILLVCTGNTCRSPMAEALGRQILAHRLSCPIAELADRGVEIRSAGTGASGDSPAAAEAIEVMQIRGLDVSGHRSQRVTQELIWRADHIITMTQAHRDMIVDLVPEAESRVTTLLDGADVEDPIGLGMDAYEACARELEAALKIRLAEIQL